MRKGEAEQIREQLLELLDERHEAGPTDYVVLRASVEPVQRATVEPASGDDEEWSVVVVVRPTLRGEPVTRVFDTLRTDTLRTDTDEDVTPEALAWHVYGLLEAGTFTR